jgi:hypothetical protein
MPATAAPDPNLTPAGYSKQRWAMVGLSILLVMLVVAALAFRALGESRRTRDAVIAADRTQDARIASNLARLERDIRADCAFKLDVVLLPTINARTGAPTSPALKRLAADARIAFIGKGCPTAINPRTGKPFGPPPPMDGK